ncbi:MAG: methyltransferase domain-containing protein [Chloroflexi bacterium]|nr:methyltransferase domain-containing protein [Chloroflexota bacterium]
MTSADRFDASIDHWLHLMTEPWNRLRYTLYRHNLARHMTGEALSVLDIGGGNGGDSIPLALQGHQVALVDYSQKMLDEAIKQAREQGVEDQISVHHTTLKSLPTIFPEAAFDVVLCHNVIQYVDDMPQAIKIISELTRNAGIISIISTNRYSETLQAATLRMDLDEALSKLDVTNTHSLVFDTPVNYYSAQEVIDVLTAAGCELLGHYGVRCVMDYIHDNDAKGDPEFYQKLERLELAMSDKYPYYLTARFFQIITHRRL